MKLNCIIIDDEPIARRLLQEYIGETDFLVLTGVAENPVKAAILLNENEVDLIFLDINMPKMNGLQFLRSANTLPMVIMTTAYGQYALDGFELSVVDYLVKPFSLARFLKATQKALELKTHRNKPASTEKKEPADHFFVKCDGKLERITYDDLLYVEAMANYVTLYTTHRKLIAYLTMKSIEEQLPVDMFMKVHKSYIVNIAKIKSIEGSMLDLGDTKVTVGQSFYDGVMDKLLKGKLFKR